MILIYLKNNAIAFDQQVNALLGGSPDETLSSRAYRVSRNGSWWRWQICMVVINSLAFNRNHCYESYLSELNRRQRRANFG
ncbi:DNA helicase UvrD [Methylotenera oryzisoli]|uniref:DNA helicase UvrD n=1 Tax=Methylotenera oryzisoli TaxID=2080758 RepID=A0A4Y9VRD3_9PROT|nr:DNA helicase UvrD [Methylotenera oryzisoli]TFW71412.1 DNA helicase UvrD [Methylotenera oryzisoli]